MTHWQRFTLIFIILAVFDRSRGMVDTFGHLMKNCSPNSSHERGVSKNFVDIIRSCMQRRALIAMDALLTDDVIPIVEGIDLVRFKKNVNNSRNSQQNDKKQRSDEQEDDKSWGSVVLSRIGRVFRTHVLKIDIDQLSTWVSNGRNVSASTKDDAIQGRGRRRRRRHHMMPMLMMGILVMGSVLIPMGFQFLAVLGGKALILAKLALMLSSIQGLKKIATNGVNYGLYHSPEGWHERASHQISSGLGHFEVPYQFYPNPPQP